MLILLGTPFAGSNFDEAIKLYSQGLKLVQDYVFHAEAMELKKYCQVILLHSLSG